VQEKPISALKISVILPSKSPVILDLSAIVIGGR
jgi:hypothetical protein